MNPLKYLTLILFLSALSIGAYMAVVYMVDPYGFYRPNDRGAFPVKPAMTKNQNMAKANIVRALKPDTVIIGSSRADYSIDPSHPALDGQQTYNAAIKGIRMAEAKDMIIHAVASGAKHIVWGIDFFTFNQNIETRADFNKARLYNMDASNTPQSDWKTLISLSSLSPTIDTIRHTNDKTRSYVLPNGQTTGGDLDIKNRKKGMVQTMSDDMSIYLSRLYFPAPTQSFQLANDTGNTLKYMDEAFQYLRDNAIRTTLFISPVHAQLLTLIYQSGLYPQYQAWKTALFINAQRYGFSIYDFTTLNDVVMEPVPTKPEKTMEYWWDLSHYKPIVGYAMISEILLEQRFTIPQFSGMVMDMNTINTFRAALIDLQCQNPDMVQSTRSAIMDAGIENRLIPPLNCP